MTPPLRLICPMVGLSLALVHSSTNMLKSVWTSGLWKPLVHINMSRFLRTKFFFASHDHFPLIFYLKLLSKSDLIAADIDTQSFVSMVYKYPKNIVDEWICMWMSGFSNLFVQFTSVSKSLTKGLNGQNQKIIFVFLCSDHDDNTSQKGA